MYQFDNIEYYPLREEHQTRKMHFLKSVQKDINTIIICNCFFVFLIFCILFFELFFAFYIYYQIQPIIDNYIDNTKHGIITLYNTSLITLSDIKNVYNIIEPMLIKINSTIEFK